MPSGASSGGTLLPGIERAEEMERDSRGGVVILGLAVAGLFAWLIFGRQTRAYTAVREAQPASRWVPAGTQEYINTKTWDIQYNADGMPVKITKHVVARIQ